MAKFITILLKLRNARGKTIIGQIMIRDGFTLSTFGEPNLAKQLYEADLEAGEDVSYNEKFNAYIRRYKGIKKEKISKGLKLEIENLGGEVFHEK